VREGIGGASIWENLAAQSLLGLEGFAEALRGHVTGKATIREIPKGQRPLAYSGPNRPTVPGQTGHPFRSNPATVPEQTGHPLWVRLN
jgi:hypothetical protein